MRPEHSRLVRLAARAAGEPESCLEARLTAGTIAISVDPAVPGALAIAATLIETLRRGPGRLLLLPERLRAREIESLKAIAHAIDAQESLRVGTPSPGAVRVHIGSRAARGMICVLADRHGMRLTTTGTRLAHTHRPTPLGIMTAAAFAGAEAFKYVAQPRPERRLLHRDLAFCPVTLSDDPGATPALPAGVPLCLGVIGVGAVGTGHARVLGEFAFAKPWALVCDPQTYAEENLGTYSLGTPADAAAELPKVELAERALRGWVVHTVAGPVTDALAEIDRGETFWPPLALSGLDSIPARHAAQALWLDRLIDAATGDTGVGLHDASPFGPCLRCLIPQPRTDISATRQLARETGLPEELLRNGNQPLQHRHLDGLPPDARRRLLPMIGRPICGLAAGAGLTGDDAETYRPSVPFVSQQAACLGVGRLVAILLGLSDLPNVVQYDALIGPQTMTRQRRRAMPGCYCQQRAATITALRFARTQRLAA